MVERLTAQTRSVDADLEILLRLFLTGIIAQQARTQRALAGVLRQDAGRCDNLLLGVFGKIDAHMLPPCLLLHHGTQCGLDDLICAHPLNGRQLAQRRIDLWHTVAEHGQTGDRIASCGRGYVRCRHRRSKPAVFGKIRKNQRSRSPWPFCP